MINLDFSALAKAPELPAKKRSGQSKSEGLRFAENGQIQLIQAGQGMYLNTPVGTHNIPPCDISVPVPKIKALAKVLLTRENPRAEINPNQAESFHLSAGTFCARLFFTNCKLPSVNAENLTEIIRLVPEAVKALFASAVPSKELAELAFTGLYFEPAGGAIASTDGKQLTIFNAPFTAKNEAPFILEFSSLEKTAKSLDKDTPLIVSKNEEGLYFANGNLIEKIDAKFPSYRDVIPNYEGASSALVNRKEFLKALKQAKVNADADSGKISLAMGAGLIQLISGNIHGKNKISCLAKTEGQTMAAAVNVNNLLKQSQKQNAETLLIKILAPHTPIFIKGESQIDYIIMPMKDGVSHEIDKAEEMAAELAETRAENENKEAKKQKKSHAREEKKMVEIITQNAKGVKNADFVRPENVEAYTAKKAEAGFAVFSIDGKPAQIQIVDAPATDSEELDTLKGQITPIDENPAFEFHQSAAVVLCVYQGSSLDLDESTLERACNQARANFGEYKKLYVYSCACWSASDAFLDKNHIRRAFADDLIKYPSLANIVKALEAPAAHDTAAALQAITENPDLVPDALIEDLQKAPGAMPARPACFIVKIYTDRARSKVYAPEVYPVARLDDEYAYVLGGGKEYKYSRENLGKPRLARKGRGSASVNYLSDHRPDLSEIGAMCAVLLEKI